MIVLQIQWIVKVILIEYDKLCSMDEKFIGKLPMIIDKNDLTYILTQTT